MQISDYFIKGDVKGAIVYMREHEEYKDILPAYIALFKKGEYLDYDIPKVLNNILKLYQIYYRDIFYCDIEESEAADKLMPSLAKLRATMVPISGRKQLKHYTTQNYLTVQLNIRLIYLKALFSEVGWTISLLEDLVLAAGHQGME